MPDCSICSKSYARAEHLRRHVETAHAPDSDTSSLREKYRCKFEGCGQSFTRSDALLRHKRLHTTWREGSRVSRGTHQPVDTSMQEGLDISQIAPRQRRTPDSARKARKSPQEWNPSANFTSQEQRLPVTSNTLAWLDNPRETDHFHLAQNSVIDWQAKQRELESAQQVPTNSALPPPQPEAQTQIASYELMDDGNGSALGLLSDLNMNGAGYVQDPYFSGLDWIFDDLTDVTLPQAVFNDSSGSNQWQDKGAEEGEAFDNDDDFMQKFTSPDTTETLNLLNLANTALSMSNANLQKATIDSFVRNSRQREGMSRTNTPPREEDGESSWPQEFRPKRKNPPTIELSAFSLPSDPSFHSRSRAASQDDIVLIDVEEEETESSRWTITDATRQKLLSYLTHSCRHSWSIYSFNPSPPSTFLTTTQLQKLIELFFAKFHPFVPVLHAATFDPAKAPPVLLLIVVTIGLVFYPSEVEANRSGTATPSTSNLRKTASILAVAFSELVRIGVCSAYEADQRGFTDVKINQAWILQQIFGIGSGDKRLNKIAERNRGGIVTATRRIGLLYQTRDPTLNLHLGDPIDSTLCQKKWLAWIEEESRNRLGWFVYLYDQTFSSYLDVAPMFRYTEVTSSMPCHADLWNAESAEVWLKKSQKVQSEATPRKTLHGVLRQLLQPSSHPNLPLHINQLEAYILTVTLYRIRWDASKEKILFDVDKLDSAMDSAAAKAMQRLANAAAMQSSSSRLGSNSNVVPLASDVQLFDLLAKLHFTAPPLFFDKLRDAAGRSGMSSKRRQDAITWLQSWMANDASSGIAMRRMLYTSSQIFALERILSSRLSNGVMHSNVRTMSLFHAALSMWAYTQFATQGSLVKDGALPEPLPSLDALDIAALGRKGSFELSDSADEHHTSSRATLIEAWICGKYTSKDNGEVCNWPLPPMAVSIEGIGCLTEQTVNGVNAGIATPSRASHVLQCFAALLARHEWGLAASFRHILLHMARHAVK